MSTDPNYFVSDCPQGIKALITKLIEDSKEIAFAGSKRTEEALEDEEQLQISRYNLETAIARKIKGVKK